MPAVFHVDDCNHKTFCQSNQHFVGYFSLTKLHNKWKTAALFNISILLPNCLKLTQTSILLSQHTHLSRELQEGFRVWVIPEWGRDCGAVYPPSPASHCPCFTPWPGLNPDLPSANWSPGAHAYSVPSGDFLISWAAVPCNAHTVTQRQDDHRMSGLHVWPPAPAQSKVRGKAGSDLFCLPGIASLQWAPSLRGLPVFHQLDLVNQALKFPDHASSREHNLRRASRWLCVCEGVCECVRSWQASKVSLLWSFA